MDEDHGLSAHRSTHRGVQQLDMPHARVPASGPGNGPRVGAVSRGPVVWAVCAVLAATSAGCGSPSAGAGAPSSGGRASASERPAAREPAPRRFRIVPDDYHVPYAGTAEDGRRFFLSEELFAPGPRTGRDRRTSGCSSGPATAPSTRSGSTLPPTHSGTPGPGRPRRRGPPRRGPAGRARRLRARADRGGAVPEAVDGVAFGWRVG